MSKREGSSIQKKLRARISASVNRRIFSSTLGIGVGALVLFSGLLSGCGGGGSSDSDGSGGYYPPFYWDYHFPPYVYPKSPQDQAEEERRKRWQLATQPIFGKNRKPVQVAALETRKSWKPAKSNSIPSNPKTHLDKIASCALRYQEEWRGSDPKSRGGTEGILFHLAQVQDPSGSSQDHNCWTPKQIEQVGHLRSDINNQLAEVLHRTSAARMSEALKLTDNELKKYNQETAQILARVGRDYQEIQENLSACRLRSALEPGVKSKPLPGEVDPLVTVSDRALLHVVGDVFGLDSGLEGQDRLQKLDLMRDRMAVLTSLSQVLNRHHYIVSEKQAEPCRGTEGVYHPEDDDHAAPLVDLDPAYLKETLDHLKDAIKLTEKSYEALPEFHEAFKKKVDALSAPGDWFYLVSGSMNHDVIYQVLKGEGAEEFKFRIYNSGDGLIFHPLANDGSTQTYFPFYERTRISKSKLTSLLFIKSLQDLPSAKGGSSIAAVYETILPELGGVLTTPPAKAEDFLDPQVAGTCSYYVLPYMETSRGVKPENTQVGKPGLGAHLEFFVKSKLLDVYFRVNTERLKQSSMVKRLANEAITFYAEEVAKNISSDPGKKGRYLDWGMARETSERLLEYQEILATSIQETEKERLKYAPRLDPQAAHLLPSGLPQSRTSYASSIGRSGSLKNQIRRIDVEGWTPSASRLNKDLSGFFASLRPTVDPRDSDNRNSENSEQHVLELQSIIQNVQELFRRIPTDSRDLFRQLGDEDLQTLISNLSDFSQMHFAALVFANGRITSKMVGLPAVSILTQLKILTLADQVVRIYGSRENGKPFENLPSLYNPMFRAILFDRDAPGRGVDQWISLLTLQDPKWVDSFRELADYWTKDQQVRKDQLPLFSWERLPLYSNKMIDYSRLIFKSESDQNFDHWSRSFANPHPDKLQWGDIEWARNELIRSTKAIPEWTAVLNSLDYRRNGYSQSNRMPTPFFEIRDISFLCHYVITGSFSDFVLRKIKYAGFQHSIRGYFSSDHESRISRVIRFELAAEPPVPRGKPPAWNYYQNSYDVFSGLDVFPTDTLKHPTSHLAKLYPDAYIGEPNYSLELSGEREALGLWSQLIEARDEYYTSPGTELNAAIPYYKRLTSAEIVSLPQVKANIPLVKDPSKSREVAITTLEMQRQLLNLSTPISALGYFKENPYRLREKRWQLLFKAIVFQPELLLKEFDKTPLFPKMLSDFCWRNFEERSREKDNLTAGFFLRMHYLLEEFNRKSGRELQWPKDRIARHGLKKLVDSYPGVSNYKNILSRDLIFTYRDVDFKNLAAIGQGKDIGAFIEAVLYRDRSALVSLSNEEEEVQAANFDVEEENAVYGLYQLKRHNLNEAVLLLDPEVRNQMFSRIVGSLGREHQDYLWSQERPPEGEVWKGKLAGVKDGSAEVDLMRPLIFMGESEVRPLPMSISELPMFKKMVRWNPDRPFVTWLGGSSYEFLDGDHRLVRIDASWQLEIQKQWGSRWYKLLSDSEVNSLAMPGSQAGSWAVMPGYYNWQSVGKVTGIVRPKPYVERPHDPNNPLWKYWQTLDRGTGYVPGRGYGYEPGDGVEVLIFEPTQEGKLYAVSRVDENSSTKPPMVQKVKYDRNTPYIDGTTLVTHQPGDGPEKSTILDALSRIELPRLIWIWKAESGVLEKVELPRFGVSFHPDSDSPNAQLISPELESYAISEHQSIPEQSEKFGDYAHYLVLQKTEGRQTRLRIAVPRFEFKDELQQGGLGTRYELQNKKVAESETAKWEEEEQNLHSYGRKSQRLYVWAIDTFDQQLKLPEAEDRFYLSLIHLWGHSAEYPSYDRARELLYGSRSELGDFRPQDLGTTLGGAREVLEWLFNQPTQYQGNKDSDPRAVAMRLGAAALAIENDLANHRYAKETARNYKTEKYFASEFSVSQFYSVHQYNLETLYDRYLDLRDRVSVRWFPEELELFLLEYINMIRSYDNKPRYTARMSELKGLVKEAPGILRGARPDVVTVPTRNWMSQGLYSTLMNRELESCAAEKGNLFSGVNSSFSELYGLSIRLNQPETVRAELIDQMTKLFFFSADPQNVAESHIAQTRGVLESYSTDRLKEEYLGFLRTLIRQGVRVNDGTKSLRAKPASVTQLPPNCIQMAELLYALATTSGDRTRLMELTLVNGKLDADRFRAYFQFRKQEPKEEWQDYSQASISFSEKRMRELSEWTQQSGIYQVDWRFLSQPSTAGQAVDYIDPTQADGRDTRPTRHWDPRTDKIPPEFKYHYQPTAQDKNRDLVNVGVVSPKTLGLFIEERELDGAERAQLSQTAQTLKQIFNRTPHESLDPSAPNYDPFIKRKLENIMGLIEEKTRVDLGQAEPDKGTVTDATLDSAESGGESDNESGTENMPNAHGVKGLHSKKAYHWHDPKNSKLQLEAYVKDLEKTSAAALEESRGLEKKILSDMRGLPKGTWDQVKEIVFQSSAVEVRPDLKHLLQAYASGAFEKVFVMNPGLTENGGKKVLDDLTSYLIQSTYYFQVEETITAFKRLLKNPDSPEELQKAYQTATATRKYKIDRHPDYLVFEYTMRFLMRQDQITNVTRLSGEKGTLLEMIMGSGKTTVLLPLASHNNAVSEKKLSIVVFPEALLPEMVKSLGFQLDQAFGQGVDRITIQRKDLQVRDKTRLTKIQNIYSRLRKDLQTERVVVTSNSSIQSLFLILIESLDGYTNLNREDESVRDQEIMALQDIFTLLRNYGHVIIDEVDSILDIMASHRFSVGKRASMESSIVNATVGLYRLLAADDQLQSRVKIPFIPASHANALPYSRESYQKHIKSRLIDLVTKEGNGKYFFDESQPGLIQAFEKLDRQGLRKYFYSESLTNNRKYLNEAMPAGAEGDELRDVVAVLFTQIHQVLPMTLDKTYLVHYGLCPPEAKVKKKGRGNGLGRLKEDLQPEVCHPFIGIPYHSGTPVPNSRFGTDLESLNYTIQAHLENRNVYEMLKLELNDLKTKFRTGRSPRIRAKISRYFDNQILNDGQILNIDNKQIESRVEAVSKDPDLVLPLVGRYAAPKIEIFPDQLFTNSHIYPILFKKVHGMSGTLWNYESYPECFENESRHFSDTFARTLFALWKNVPTRQVRVIDTPAQDEVVSSTIATLLNVAGTQGDGKPLIDELAPSLIDQGGFFRGKDNQEIVRALLQYPPNQTSRYSLLGIPQLIYFDAADRFQLLRFNLEEFTTRPYVSRETDRDITGAFWDMRHTTGADLKVSPQNVALLTLSKFSIMRDLLQSAWRLRELERLQSVIPTITRDDLRLMHKLLLDVYGDPSRRVEEEEKLAQKDNVAKSVDLEDILLFLATHEAIKVGEVNYRSVKASQRAVIVDAIFDGLVDRAAFSVEKDRINMILSFKNVKPFFSNPRGPKPFERYGIPVVSENTYVYLMKEIIRVLNPFKVSANQVFNNIPELERDFTQTLDEKQEFLRKRVVTPISQEVESEEEMEIETEQEQEMQMQVETEVEVELQKVDASYNKAKIDWNREKFLSGDLIDHPTTDVDLPTGKISEEVRSKLNPVMSMQDILNRGNLGNISDVFDKKLFGSLNLFPVFQSSTVSNDQVFVPFEAYQGLIDYILVSLNPDNKTLQSAVLITRDEALSVLGEWLVADADRKYSTPSSRSLLIYQIGNGFIRTSEHMIRAVGSGGAEGEKLYKTFMKIEASPEFQSILLQAKFLSGRIHYTEDETKGLTQWLKASGKSGELRSLLNTHIFKFRENTLKDFEHSALFDVFTNLDGGSKK